MRSHTALCCLLTCGLGVAACRSSGRASHADTRVERCIANDIHDRVCDVIKISAFDPTPGGRLVLTECEATMLPPNARVAWRDSEGQTLYRGIARFEKSKSGTAYELDSLVPEVWAWPCDTPECERMMKLPDGLEISVPAVAVCRGEGVALGQKSVEVMRPGPNVCEHPQSLKGWCTWPGPSEAYWWMEHSWRQGYYFGMLGPTEGNFSLVSQGRRTMRQLNPLDAQRLFEVASSRFWEGDRAHTDASCRDGNNWMIAGRRPGEWRVVLGSCQDDPYGVSAAGRALLETTLQEESGKEE